MDIKCRWFVAGDAVAKWSPEMDTNPEELGEYAQGDILFPANTARNGLKAASTHWEKGIVPFEIGPYFSEFLFTWTKSILHHVLINHARFLKVIYLFRPILPILWRLLKKYIVRFSVLT